MSGISSNRSSPTSHSADSSRDSPVAIGDNVEAAATVMTETANAVTEPELAYIAGGKLVRRQRFIDSWKETLLLQTGLEKIHIFD
ncbi:hypothetical protein IV203_003299 [Nitzschia inconspicua]|uniref:Uncharacterized protein n=1 Tax=Nitzschia inconspicua TaxID=303405 RepID=A0A9K3L322_9STRA|nr:hypothetical protein IV203_003299 [Nitzschia inconspicua]